VSILIYTMYGCPFCLHAKAFLHERDIPFQEIVVTPGSEEWVQMREKTGSSSLPQVFIGEENVGGYAHLVDLEATGALYEKLGQNWRKSDTPLYDVIIVGAGPAGLSAAIYTIRKLMKTLIISKDVGGQVTWTNDVDNYLGFSQVNAAELVAKFESHVKTFGVEKVIGKNVSAVDLAGRIKRVTLEDGKTYYGKTVVIATGGSHRPLKVPGEKELLAKGVSYCSTCDAPLFDDADVAVVGGGNSALEAVLDLVNIARRIYLISLTPLTGDSLYQEKVRHSDKVEILTECRPTRILGDAMVQGIEYQSLMTGETHAVEVEGVFVEIGLLPNSSIFIDTLATNKKGEILVDKECRTGMAGVFACGDVTDVPYKQVVVAVGEGAKAALSAYEYLLNQK